MLTAFRGIVYAVNFSRTIYIFIGSLSQRREWLSTNEILNGEVSISGQCAFYFLFSLIQHPSHLALVCCISIQSKKQASRRHMLREVVQGMGLCDYGVWLGKYKMVRQVPGRADWNPQAWSGAAVHRQNFFPEALALLLRPSN